MATVSIHDAPGGAHPLDCFPVFIENRCSYSILSAGSDSPLNLICRLCGSFERTSDILALTIVATRALTRTSSSLYNLERLVDAGKDQGLGTVGLVESRCAGTIKKDAWSFLVATG